MIRIFIKIIIGLILASAIPYFFISSPAWQPSDMSLFAYPLYLVTETGTFPYAMITCGVLAIIFAFYLNLLTFRHSARLMKLIIILAAATIVGQAVKSVLKYSIKEPRPYVVWLFNDNTVQINEFYQQTKAIKKELIREQLNTKPANIPNWLESHWQKEISYSFPSGHTIFSTLWLFLALFFFRLNKHKLLLSVIIVWTLLMELSRIKLGMHYAWDILAGVPISALMAFCFYTIARRWKLIEK